MMAFDVFNLSLSHIKKSKMLSWSTMSVENNAKEPVLFTSGGAITNAGYRISISGTTMSYLTWLLVVAIILIVVYWQRRKIISYYQKHKGTK